MKLLDFYLVTNFKIHEALLFMMHAVYISAILPQKGPTIVAICPEDLLSFDDTFELSLKCMPMGGKEGDFSSILFKDFQAVSYLTSTPIIDEKIDSRETITSIGFLLDVFTNPIPYKDLLAEFVSKCKNNESFNLSNLEKIIPQFLKLKTQNKITISLDGESSCKFELKKEMNEKDGLDLLDEALWGSQ